MKPFLQQIIVQRWSSIAIAATLLTPTLTPILTLTISVQSAQANPTFAPAIASCLTNPACTILVITAGGVIYWEIRNGSDPILIPWPILQDPEETLEDWSDYVWADSEEEARQKCQAIADGYHIELVSVRRTSRQGKRYECTFRG
jgi:hypothetical protein